MADSTLVPSGGGGSGVGFAQQGSVDWVALSGSTLTFSVEVLSRFSKAGVEMVTIAMGQALFARFNIKPDAQRRFSEAISKLKAVSSYGDILWFGFGVKHVIRTLAETEQGIACAGICACLSVSYDSLYGSKVLKAMADIQRAPQTMTPSLSQWSSLLNICAGGVTDSTFPCLVKGISRFLSPSQEARRCFLLSPTTPEALAGALVELASVSDGTLHSTTLIGGIDCSWIAAVAQWLLSLRVQIIDADGTILYKSQGTSKDQYPQVIILRHTENSRLGTAVMSRSFFVPPGVFFFHLEDPALNNRPRQHIFSSGRSQWSEILQDSFGQTFHKLLAPGNIMKFARFLYFGLDFPPEQRDISLLNPWQGDSVGPIERRRAWLEFTARRLPELTQLAHVACFDMDVIDSKITTDAVRLEMLSLCPCTSCRGAHLASILWREPTTMCLFQVGITILEFIYTLSWLNIDDALQPSIDGLRAMYINRGRSLISEEGFTILRDVIRRGLWLRPIASIIFPLFTGLNILSSHFSEDESARSGGGISIFLPSLVNPATNPLSQLRVNIVPGHIEKNNTMYESVFDFRHGHGSDGSFTVPASRYLKDFGSSPKINLVIEETIAFGTLEAYFWIHPSEPGGNKTVTSQDLKLTAFGPSKIRSSLVRSISCEPCLARQVTIFPPTPALSILAEWTLPWTGPCSAAGKNLWTGVHPSLTLHSPPGEWALISPETLASKKIEVLRACYSLMYAIICQPWASSDIRLALVPCLPCFYLNTVALSNNAFPQREPAGVVVQSMKENPPWRLEIAARIESLTPDEPAEPSDLRF